MLSNAAGVIKPKRIKLRPRKVPHGPCTMQGCNRVGRRRSVMGSEPLCVSCAYGTLTELLAMLLAKSRVSNCEQAKVWMLARTDLKPRQIDRLLRG